MSGGHRARPRRLVARYPLSLGVALEVARLPTVHCQTYNVSRGGLFLATDLRLELFSALALTVALPSGRCLKLQGRVAHALVGPRARQIGVAPGIGVRLEALAEPARRSLDALVEWARGADTRPRIARMRAHAMPNAIAQEPMLRLLLEYVDGQRDPEALAKELALDADTIERMLDELKKRDIIELVAASERSELEDGARRRAGELPQELGCLQSQLSALDHYALLGVGPDASPAAIRSAFQARTAALGRDADSSVEGTGLAPLRGALREAFSVLSSPVRREEYDEYLQRAQWLQAAEGMRARASLLPAPPEPREPDGQSLSAVGMRRRAELRGPSELTGAAAAGPATSAASGAARSRPAAPARARSKPPQRPSARAGRASSVAVAKADHEAYLASARASAPPPASASQPPPPAADQLRGTGAPQAPGRPVSAAPRTNARPSCAPAAPRARSERPVRSEAPRQRFGAAAQLLAQAEAAHAAGQMTEAHRHLRLLAAMSFEDARLKARFAELKHKVSRTAAVDFEKQAAHEEKLQRWEAAAQCWLRVAEGRPNDSLALQRAALAQLNAGVNVRLAVETAKRAVALSPNDAQAHHMLAKAYSAAGMHANARRELDAARRCSSGGAAQSDDASHTGLVRRLLGRDDST